VNGPAPGAAPRAPGPAGDRTSAAVRLLQTTAASSPGTRPTPATDTVVLLRPGPPDRLPPPGPGRTRLLSAFAATVTMLVDPACCAWLDPTTLLVTTTKADAPTIAAKVSSAWNGSPAAHGTTVMTGTGLVAGRPTRPAPATAC